MDEAADAQHQEVTQTQPTTDATKRDAAARETKPVVAQPAAAQHSPEEPKQVPTERHSAQTEPGYQQRETPSLTVPTSSAQERRRP